VVARIKRFVCSFEGLGFMPERISACGGTRERSLRSGEIAHAGRAAKEEKITVERMVVVVVRKDRRIMPPSPGFLGREKVVHVQKGGE
jgi:hypothetical protein